MAVKEQILRSGQPMHLGGSVDPSTGSIQHDGDIHIAGDICDLFEVSTSGNIAVDGVIGAARVRAGKGLKALGGIMGKGRGKCVVGGNVGIKHISNAVIEAQGHVVVDAIIWESQVYCSGELMVTNGPVAASQVVVGGSVRCRTLGLASGAPTVIEVGVNEFLRRMAPEAMAPVLQLQKRLAGLRASVQPSMQHTKALTAREKERAMELLFEAEEVATELEHRMALLRAEAKRLAPLTQPRIHVEEMIYPNVTLRFARWEATTTCAMTGPLQVVLRNVGREQQVFLVDEARDMATPLQTRRHEDPATEQLQRLISAA